jgi:L-malate glycosyltransferase
MTPPLRILILTPTAFPTITGNAMTVERWRRSLCHIGHTVRVLCSLGVEANELAQEIRRFQPDVIHAHHGVKSGALLLTKAVEEATARIPFTVSPAGTDINREQGRDGDATATLETFLRVCRASRGIIVQSPWVLQCIRDLVLDMVDRIFHVPKAFLWQGDEEMDLKKALAGQSEKFLFFLPAGIRPVKGNLACLEGLAKVNQARPQVCVVFAGPALDAPYAEQFSAMIGRFSAFARWIPQIPPAAMHAAYRSADAVLNVSFSEGLSNCLLEAIAAGRPILASDIPGNRWLVLGNPGDLPCGDLFDPRNPDDFIQKAIRLVDDEERRRDFVAACRLRAANLPTPEEEVAGLDRIYRTVMRI